MTKDHPIYLESISFIRSRLACNNFNHLENQVLERLIHTSGDFTVQNLLVFSKNACKNAQKAIFGGAPILTDTDMAAVAIKSMAKKAHGNHVYSVTQWVKEDKEISSTKTAYGIEKAWIELSESGSEKYAPIVVFGSSPTALEKLLDILQSSNKFPSLIVGMPVGFIGVENSKKRLLQTNYPYAVLTSSRGGAAMAAACVNALLRSSI